MKSRLYREITQQDITEIAHDLLGTGAQITEARVLKGGMFNTTYYLEAEGQAFALRVGPVNRQLLFAYEKDMMAAEPHFHALLSAHGIPTTQVVCYRPAGSVIDREYIITTYLPSIPMNDETLKGADLAAAYTQAGAYTHKMHDITGKRFGWWRPDGSKAYDTWYAFIKAFADECIQQCGRHGIFDEPDLKLFDAYMRDASTKKLLDAIQTPRFVHTDLWQGNVLLKKENGSYTVAAIIDHDRAIFGDTQWDLAMPWMHNDAYLQGYGSMPVPDADTLERRTLYRVIGNLFGAYVANIQYDAYPWSIDIRRETEPLLRELCGH